MKIGALMVKNIHILRMKSPGMRLTDTSSIGKRLTTIKMMQQMEEALFWPNCTIVLGEFINYEFHYRVGNLSKISL